MLLTGEYVVLDGATALAFPTSKGQQLEVEETNDGMISWESYDDQKHCWFKTALGVRDNQLISLQLTIGTKAIEKVLIEILEMAKSLNPSFLNDKVGYKLTTTLDFPRAWGLGTSSTLINNIAQWAQVDAYALLFGSFGGSGYDIAAAQSNKPFLYSLKNKIAAFEPIEMNWSFTDALFFVHLNQKQNSKEGIERYRKYTKNKKLDYSVFSEISTQLIHCSSLQQFSELLQRHEKLISKIIDTPTVKERLFSDYDNTIKSLGAWGGDFILAIGDEKDKEYFRRKNYSTIISFKDMMK